MSVERRLKLLSPPPQKLLARLLLLGRWEWPTPGGAPGLSGVPTTGAPCALVPSALGAPGAPAALGVLQRSSPGSRERWPAPSPELRT